ncbi:hypothetical protein [Mucilaginibacter sp. dw_454]|uniref:tetratricopeptide repeat protein n=1 Tax=Mucilaginibacter sp. dw_454 TaxID=2720079 RepID=UPI001BD2E4C2|nr:hypothetical protein [Mucilaginibacter sp. dw_454]
MTRKIYLILLLNLFLVRPGKATDLVGTDSLLTILQQKNGPHKERQLILSIRYYFSGRLPAGLPAAKKSLDSVLAAFPVPNAGSLGLFVETMYRMQLRQYVEAEKVLVRAISLADRADDHYLLYGCFTQLAFLQALKGNTTEAVTSFRQARNEATTLNDAYLQILVDINISDIYHRNKLYGQSLHYLDQARALMHRRELNEPDLNMMILVNKVENYFSTESVDSLAKYSRLLLDLKISSSRLYSFQQRSIYMLYLLQARYNDAVKLLAKLKKDPSYAYDLTDDQNLTNALYHSGQVDSARVVARQLIADQALQNHPEVTLPLYEMLGRIALAKSEKDLAIRRFDEALQQAKMQIIRLVEVDTIAARLRLDDMQSSYISREGGFKRERLWLIFGVVTVSLVLVVGAMLYRNNQQKRKFERLLFESKRSELSFINSHEIRRHLSNILGIIDTISQADDRHQEYLESEAHLLSAANDLDKSIREIADKLSDDIA